MFAYSSLNEVSDDPARGFEYEVLNELKDLSSRTDANCLYHTRFLFEFDDMLLAEQMKILDKYKNIICRAVYSGSKSIHMILEFKKEHELYCAENYKEIWHALNDILFEGKADEHCANPSRLTRTPNAIRYFDDKPATKQLLILEQDVTLHLPEQIYSYVASYKFIPSKVKTFYNCNGKCRHYDKIEHYLNTPYRKMTGNGDSDSSLFNAILCCVKYKDNQTLDLVLDKARDEHWSEREIQRKISNAEKLC